METHLKVALTAITLAGLWSAEAPAASDPYVGTWKKNPKESFGMSDPAGSETTVIRRHDSVLDYTWTGTGSDGKTETFSYSGTVDGKERPLPGNSGLRGAMIRTPSGVIEGKLWGPDGSLEDKYCILSAPGRLTCFATFTDRSGKVSLFKEVFDRE
jgi:hypothetical protein